MSMHAESWKFSSIIISQVTNTRSLIVMSGLFSVCAFVGSWQWAWLTVNILLNK